MVPFVFYVKKKKTSEDKGYAKYVACMCEKGKECEHDIYIDTQIYVRMRKCPVMY